MKPKLSRLLCVAGIVVVTAAASADDLRNSFLSPPSDARPTVRWWWFGPSVVKPQLEREMRFMKEGGFGGFEVQPTYPLALDGQYPGLENIRFLSPGFFDMLRFTAGQAQEIGLRMDLTLGSGWPYGGPMFSRGEAAQSIADGGTVPIKPGETAVEAPVGHGRGSSPNPPVIAALLGPLAGSAPGADRYVSLPLDGRGAKLPADLRGATHVRFFVRAPARLMNVKRAAYGAEGHIIDHYSRASVEKFIRDVAQPEISACAPNPPYSIFCDSLEVTGEGWTPDFPAEFRRRRGYDILPLLPALFDDRYPGAAEIRGDYGRTIAELFDDAFAGRFARLARANHTRFRLQAYGTPPTTLATYARVDLDEGENYRWRAMSGTRWASSASHLLGRKVTSAEAFTWLHSPVFMAAPLDIKAESNLQFLNGVNQLLFHGWPYTAPGVEYPGWRFYAAAVFDEKNPWWIVMPDITRYLARTSFLLRAGTPVDDVAVYLPEEDAFTRMTPRNLQMVGAGGNGILNPLVNRIVPPILDAGFNFDFIDAGVLALRGKVAGRTLSFGDVGYRIVILPDMHRITPSSLRTLERFADDGGTLIAVGHPPSAIPGYMSTAADRDAGREILRRLFEGRNARGIVVAEGELAAVLGRRLQPDVAFARPEPDLGFIHRHCAERDIYFLANTSNHPISISGSFRVSSPHAEWWDANTGVITNAAIGRRGENSAAVEIDLPPYGTRFLVFSNGASGAVSPDPAEHRPIESIDVSRNWNVTFRNAAPEPDPAPAAFATLESWTDRPQTHFFSGVATYRRDVVIPDRMVGSGARLDLDLGKGSPATVAGGPMGMRANFQPPVGDAAIVFVNGHRAGSVWCPPYRVNVTGLLHAGANELRVEVANRAVNFMADTQHHPLPDYRALNASRKFGGRRFEPQDMRYIQVVPSGLLGPVVIEATRR